VSKTENDEKAFKKLQESLRRIQARTERDMEIAIAKFKKGCKGDKLAFTPPLFQLTMPKLYLLTEN
jgi:hypothetical protein